MAEALTARKAGSAPEDGAVWQGDRGRVPKVNAGDFVEVSGEQGRFKVKWGNRPGTEVTVWGPFIKGAGDQSGGPWGSASMRTFRVERIVTAVTVDAVKAKAEAVSVANGDVDYASMTPGQKAAWTKRMKALTAVA